ncbi:hypothetical protein [Marinomonas arenicola]|uniref:Uncharacterized protein n=1 Tax=Marinomonas arenicola TaxID=569601 RepID=A0ABU9G906_9GAMM
MKRKLRRETPVELNDMPFIGKVATSRGQVPLSAVGLGVANSVGF